MGRPADLLSRIALRCSATRRLPAGAGDRVALTFDDGPSPETTPELLATLAELGARATFFLCGDACAQRPRLVEAMLADGHDVGNHGYAHLAPREATTVEYVADVRRTQRLLEQIAGEPLPRRYRPPFGRLDLRALLELRRRGYEIVLWDTDGRDSFDRDARQVRDNVVAGARARSIVLLHDDYPWTVAAVPSIVGALRRRGLELTGLEATASDHGAPPVRTPVEPLA